MNLDLDSETVKVEPSRLNDYWWSIDGLEWLGLGLYTAEYQGLQTSYSARMATETFRCKDGNHDLSTFPITERTFTACSPPQSLWQPISLDHLWR